MKKAWITYNCTAVLILASLIVLDYVVNIVIGKYDDRIDTLYTGLALYLAAFHILLAMPLWLIVLLFNRSRMDRKTIGIGLGLFLVFLAMTAYPVISVIGYTAF